MPLVYCRFTAYTCDREGSYIFDGCEYKYTCSTCVPVIDYITTSCCAVIFDFWPLYIWPKTDLLKVINEAQVVQKTSSSLCPVLYNFFVTQQETQVSNPLLSESLPYFTVWGFVLLMNRRQQWCLFRGQSQGDRRRKGWKRERERG